ncbi:protein-export chaperone SecB [Paraburkholderia sp. CNPSo 3272]|uniref:protein-export chaperone SecB n=1 Tax=Paraburkholderia sp. CNPSo 3272 TaxID=2940931 RepID=UPI0020B66ECD|nr:protein-export chaperone SecB [Paraburkholderia sp. CNPSo 3272]MCP3722375.1 protein-export chaperone SecB [Paraburkholderia sp. CNPSo 3272]
MQRSPLDLRHYHFNRFELQVRGDRRGPQTSSNSGQYPSFDEVDYSANVQVSAPPDQTSPFQFALKLALVCQPKSPETQFPYTFNVEAEGFFQVQAEDEDKGRKLLLANGTAVLYGAIREQLLTFSSRFSQGPMLLPTVNFLNLLPKTKAEETVPPLATSKRKRKKSTEG